MTNFERAKGKAGGKKYAPAPPVKSNGWQKVRTHQEKDKRHKQMKKFRKNQIKSLNVKEWPSPQKD